MYISNIKLWNFRKYGPATIIPTDAPNLDLDLTNGLNVIIGENDSGKTAIIDAIKLVLRTHSYEYIRVEDKDFFHGQSRFRIEITIKDFKDTEAKNFTEWLGWEGIEDEARPYLRLVYDVERNGKHILPSDVRAGVDDDGYQLTAEAREYLKTTYLKPLRDAQNELVAKRNSRISQILLGDSAFRGNEDSNDLIFIFQSLKQDLEKFFTGEYTNIDGEKPQEGKTIKDKIDVFIREFYSPDHESVFEASATDIKAILERIALSLKDEANPGLGTLNKLFMAAELLHLNKTDWSGVRIGLIEEMEAHLHPQAQMQVIETFQRQKSIQLIITTHSPNLASKLKLQSLIICSGNKVFPMGSDYTMLEKNDYRFLERFLDTTKANLFFAKGLILVEGWAEEILIPAIAKKLDINLTEKGVSVVNITNTSFLRYSKIFQRRIPDFPEMELPVAIITDLDVKPERENDLKNGKTLKEFKKEQKEQEYDGAPVKTFVSEHWTLEYCIGISPSLQKALFIATRMAGVEMEASGIYRGKWIDQSWHQFSEGKDELEIGKDLYENFIGGGKKISKSIIAQFLAEFIERGKTITKAHLESEEAIRYIIKAIKYAARI